MKRSFASAHKRLLQLGSALSLGLGCSLAQAQEPAYPSGPLEMIVPFAPGGPVDALARTFARALELRAKHTVIVQSRPGGSFVVAMSAVNLAPANGHSFYFGPVTPITVHPHWMKTLPFKKDGFIPVCQTFENTFFLVGSPSLPHQDFAQLLAFAKANPGKLSYGHTGVASSVHLAAAELFGKLGVEAADIPYRGEPLIQQDLIGGQLPLGMVTAAFVGANPNMRAYLSFAATRLPAYPNVPTAAEQGYKVTPSGYGGIFVKAGTPAAMVQKLESLCKDAMSDTELQEMGRRQSQLVEFLGSKAFGARIDADHAQKAELLKTVRLDR
jgi:tripartite-type tricarboxylate transporter receptor subunit TctC